MDESNSRITFRALLLGTVFSGLFAYLTVYFENKMSLILTATQVATLPYVLLLLTVWLVNPVSRFLRICRPFSMAEILIIFVMGGVSSGISTFGLASQIVPVMGNLFNQHWNTDQAKWENYIEPYISESFFLSEPGIQEKAIAYRSALLGYEDVKKVYDVARALKDSQASIDQAALKEKEAEESDEPEAAKTIKLNRAMNARRYAQRALALAEIEWESLRGTHDPAKVQEVLETYPAKVEKAKAEMEAKDKELRELEGKAFAKVETFRRGLPKELRAIPGFIPHPGEPVRMYFSRIRRLRHGMKALRPLRALSKSLKDREAGAASSGLAQDVSLAVSSATETLQPLSDPAEVRAQKEGLDAELDSQSKALEEASRELRDKNQERRLAEAERFDELEDEIETLDDRAATLREDLSRISVELEKARQELEFVERIGTAIENLKQLEASVAADNERPPAELSEELALIIAEFPKFDGTLRRFLVGDIEWGGWLRPVFNWGLVILLTYVILMTFNVLIFRQWAHNEKLIYPLAELPELLAGREPGIQTAEGTPSIFRGGLFWAGFSVSAVILGYNLFAASEVITGLKSIDLYFKWADYVKDSIFSGLYYSRCHIFFTMVGLSFLIPAKISFSLWFFYLCYLGQLQSMVWAGHGVNERSFPSMWWYTLNFKTAEAAGALMVFAAVILWKCRKSLLCFFTPSFISNLDPDERSELRISSFLFLASSVGLILFLWLRLGANLYYTIFAYVVILVITIGLIRAVAEGGILGFQAWCGPFHFIHSLFGFDKAWTAPEMFSPLMVYYSLMFLDIKTFIAPAMANSIKIRDDLRMSRLRFHVAIALGIGIAAVIAILSQIILAYTWGADGMQSWFHTSFPKGLFQKIVTITKNHPVDTASGAFWLGFGAVAMGGLLYLRQFVFWLPHPIGMIMLVNPIMQTYWFSIFLGWVFKSLVTKYGNKDTYKNMRCMFVGLIVGELIIIVLAMLVAIWTGKNIRIDLNRN